MEWFRGHYLNDPGEIADPRASPLAAADLAGLPPALIYTAGLRSAARRGPGLCRSADRGRREDHPSRVRFADPRLRRHARRIAGGGAGDGRHGGGPAARTGATRTMSWDAEHGRRSRGRRRTTARAVGPARAEQGGEPHRAAEGGARGVRRDGLWRGQRARHRAPHRPRLRHLLQLLQGQGRDLRGGGRRADRRAPEAPPRRPRQGARPPRSSSAATTRSISISSSRMPSCWRWRSKNFTADPHAARQARRAGAGAGAERRHPRRHRRGRAAQCRRGLPRRRRWRASPSRSRWSWWRATRSTPPAPPSSPRA